MPWKNCSQFLLTGFHNKAHHRQYLRLVITFSAFSTLDVGKPKRFLMSNLKLAKHPQFTNTMANGKCSSPFSPLCFNADAKKTLFMI